MRWIYNYTGVDNHVTLTSLSYIRLLEVCTEINLGATEARINICHQNCYYWRGVLDVC